MSLRDELDVAFRDVLDAAYWDVDKDTKLHGADAIKVTVALVDGRNVVGTFATEDKSGFGGVEFSSRKDIPALMRSKVLSVLAGTADD